MNSADLVANSVNYVNLLSGSPPEGIVKMPESRGMLQMQDVGSGGSDSLQQIHVVIEDHSDLEEPHSQVSAYPASSTSHSEDSPIHLPTTYHLLNNPDQVAMTSTSDPAIASTSKQLSASSSLTTVSDQQVAPMYFLKQMSASGHQFSSLVDANNKPISFPQGVQLLNLPSLPLPTSGSASDGVEPLYVNAKQYHRILKRREARAKLEAMGKLPKVRRKYLYESRHRHACKRARACGGKFTTGCQTNAKENSANNTTKALIVIGGDGDEKFSTLLGNMAASSTVEQVLNALNQ
ncbi:hypothetical protein NP493_601g00016 [Ridgeia piscesae]|uniref:Nuclear transcription factor Y subunit n=1 Tax=Ridgeia piscesae TaxID=27915 RepID=A0AAD9KTG8_RIDPI|nr:hypothetical protein NP493_601g00016 [Ridgeia piscesae]